MLTTQNSLSHSDILLSLVDNSLQSLNKECASWVSKQLETLSTGNFNDDIITDLTFQCQNYLQQASNVDFTYQRPSGDVLSFGMGDCGQLALDQEKMSAKRPKLVQALHESPVSHVACGGLHNVAVVSETNTINGWGCGDDGSLGFKILHDNTVFVPTPVVFEGKKPGIFCGLAAGDCQTLAVDVNGSVWMWGCYKDKEGKQWRDDMPHAADIIEGEKPQKGKQIKPVELTRWDKEKYGGAQSVACGSSFNAATTTKGFVLTWGLGETGELGRGKMPDLKTDTGEYDLEIIKNQYLTPLPVHGALTMQKAVRIVACGGYHMLVVSDLFELYSTGLNNYGQLGLGDIEGRDTLAKVTAFEKHDSVIMCSAGIHHTLCYTDGDKEQLWSFGRGDSGQLGLTSALPAVGYCENTPQKIPLTETVAQIDCGDNHNLVLTTEGSVYTWGYGDMGALGHGVENDEYSPRKLDTTKGLRKDAITGVKVHRVFGGGQHSILVASLQR